MLSLSQSLQYQKESVER
ncbi:protein NinF, partial [Escherichia coli]